MFLKAMTSVLCDGISSPFGLFTQMGAFSLEVARLVISRHVRLLGTQVK